MWIDLDDDTIRSSAVTPTTVRGIDPRSVISAACVGVGTGACDALVSAGRRTNRKLTTSPDAYVSRSLAICAEQYRAARPGGSTADAGGELVAGAGATAADGVSVWILGCAPGAQAVTLAAANITGRSRLPTERCGSPAPLRFRATTAGSK